MVRLTTRAWAWLRTVGDLHTSSTSKADPCNASISICAGLRDGTPVLVRAVRPDDKERVRCAFERLSPRTVRRRFFAPKRELTSEELRMATELDFRDHVSLALAVEEQSGERLIAVGRFVRVAPGADRAELALTVIDGYQHRGAGTLLMQHLVSVARSSGVRELMALVQDESREMLQILLHLRLPLRSTIEQGVHRVVVSLADSAAG